MVIKFNLMRMKLIYMINLEQFLLDNMKSDVGCYALVAYNHITEAIWFSNYCDLNKKGEVFFLESPCELFKICEVEGDIDRFCKKYMNDINLLDGATEENLEKEYIEEYVKPMIIDNSFYSIENFQVAPYLPNEVDGIKIITERECLIWLLKK